MGFLSISNITGREDRGTWGHARGTQKASCKRVGPHLMFTAALVLCTWSLGQGLYPEASPEMLGVGLVAAI